MPRNAAAGHVPSAKTGNHFGVTLSGYLSQRALRRVTSEGSRAQASEIFRFCMPLRDARGRAAQNDTDEVLCTRTRSVVRVPPNHCMQPTPQSVIKFAFANLPPVWCAADAGC